MRRILFSIILLLAGLSAASASGSIETDADGWYHFTNLTDFRGVDIRTRADVTITQGDDWEVKARGDERDLEDLDIYVRGRTLIVRRESLFSFVGGGDRLEIDITLPRLVEVVLDSPGSVRTMGLIETTRLDLVLSGTGEMWIEAIADTIVAKSSGTGRFDFRGRADRLIFSSTGTGSSDIEILVNRSEIRSTGTGKIELQGSTDLLDLRMTGNGKLRADRFEARKATVTITGTGNTEVYVTESLEAVLTGTGSLYYRGDPELSGIRTTGTGRVIKD